MWVDAWELSSTHPGYTSTTTATYIKIHSIRCTEWYEVKFMAARPTEVYDEAMCPTDMLVVPSLTWIGGLPQCQRHAQMRRDSEEEKRLGRGRELIRLRLKPKYHERKRRLGFRVSGFLREVANFYGLNCDFSSYYWPSLSE